MGDTKKEEISDKKFLTILFLFTFSSKFTLFFNSFLILHHKSCIFVLFPITLAILYLYPFIFFFFLYFQLCLSLADYVCLLRLSSVMLNENKHWVYLNLIKDSKKKPSQTIYQCGGTHSNVYLFSLFIVTFLFLSRLYILYCCCYCCCCLLMNTFSVSIHHTHPSFSISYQP